MTGNDNRNKKSNGTFAIFAGVAVAFMIITTIISVIFYRRNLHIVQEILEGREYKKYNSYVMFITDDNSSVFWDEVYSAAKKYGALQGVCVDRIADEIDGDFTKAQLLEIAINSDCDGILLEGDNSEKTASLIKEADDAGIAVITMNTDAENSNRKSFVGTSNYNISNIYAQAMVESVSGAFDSSKTKADVLILSEQEGLDDNSVNVMNGMQEYFAGSQADIPTLVFTQHIISQTDTFAVEEYVKDLFLNGDLPEVVICLDEETTSTVYQSMIDYNKVGKLILFGYYQNNTILEGIEQGVISGSVTVDTKSLGENAAKAFYEYFNTGYVSELYVINNTLIDKSNVAKYRKEKSDEKED